MLNYATEKELYRGRCDAESEALHGLLPQVKLSITELVQ